MGMSLTHRLSHRRRRNSADGYLAEAAGRCLSPVEARSPQRAPSPDSLAAGRPMSPDAVSRGMSSQVMGLEGLMYGSPTYVRPSRCSRAPGTLLYCQELGPCGRHDSGRSAASARAVQSGNEMRSGA